MFSPFLPWTGTGSYTFPSAFPIIWQSDVDPNISKQTREFSYNIPAEANHSQHQSLLHYHFPVKIANTTEFPAEVTPASYWVCRACPMCLIHSLCLAKMISSLWFLNALRQNTGTVMSLLDRMDSYEELNLWKMNIYSVQGIYVES